VCVAVDTQTILPAEFVGNYVFSSISLKFHLPVCGVSVFAVIKPKAKEYTPFGDRVILNSRNYNYVQQLFAPKIYINGSFLFGIFRTYP